MTEISRHIAKKKRFDRITAEREYEKRPVK